MLITSDEGLDAYLEAIYLGCDPCVHEFVLRKHAPFENPYHAFVDTWTSNITP